MKIIHTADWHIGKSVNQVSLLADQEYALQSLVALLERECPDVLVVAGDVYDRSVPPVEAVELLDRTLTTILLDLNIPVLMIAGNHDSPDRLAFGSKILKNKGLHIAGRLQQTISKVSLRDSHGPVHFYLVPYAPPPVVRDIFARSDVTDHDSAMRAIIDSIRQQWEPTERNVLVTHGFVRGVEALDECDSEKPLSLTLAIGGTEYVDVRQFDDFSYTALGHLHRFQRAGSERVCYAGSLLKYSFSETQHQKAVAVVELGAGSELTVEAKPLLMLRDMRKIKGGLNELVQPAVSQSENAEDYLHVTLTDEGELLEPMSKLRAVYPNVLGLDFAVRKSGGESKTAAGEGYKQKTKLELFEDFYRDMTGLAFAEEKAAAVKKAIYAVDAANGGEQNAAD